MDRVVGGDARFDPSTSRRRFVVACGDGDQICNLPRIAAAFARELPMAQLHVVSIDQLIASDGLAAGTVDAAFVPADGNPRGLHTRDLYADEAAVLLRKGPFSDAARRVGAPRPPPSIRRSCSPCATHALRAPAGATCRWGSRTSRRRTGVPESGRHTGWRTHSSSRSRDSSRRSSRQRMDR
jgi:DNA-binding transcriptional LysR family regulator